MFNDEEEDENAVGAVRYPCMPSLVSLQQMRNRLHLAYLGRKLMKWTALATGRELRRLAFELDKAYKSFGEDMRNAFMLLARGRYFYPNLNKMVLENAPNKSSVRVTSHTKTVSGVKVIQYEILESGQEPYEHLGIEKGGQKIHEAKIAWLDLLKRMILMLELKTSFILIETANKNATKKQKVLGKVVVPRTNASMAYIRDELEEMAREEFFRLKKILEIKRKMYKYDCRHKEPVEGCKICEEKFKGKEVEKEDECIICGTTISEYPKIEPLAEDETGDKGKIGQSMLELFKRNISDIIEITEDMKGRKALTAESVEKFLETASQLREKLGSRIKGSKDQLATVLAEGGTEDGLQEEKLPEAGLSKLRLSKTGLPEAGLAIIEPVEAGPAGEKGHHHHKHLEPISDDVSIHKLCDVCIKRYEEEQAAKGAQLARIREEQEQAQKEAARLKIQQSQDTAVDLELGVFETEEKKIIKIIRVKKEDGTISEEKRVITSKKETKISGKPRQENQDSSSMYQPSGSSSRSTPYPSNSKNIGVVLVEDRSILRKNNAFGRKAKSEMALYVSSMICPIVRNCISSASMMSSSATLDDCCVTAIGNRDSQSESTLKQLYAPSSEVQEALISLDHSKVVPTSDSVLNISNYSE